MKKITSIIVKKFIKNSEDFSNPSVRTDYGKLEGWVGIIGNLALSAIKFYAGIVSGSAALLADAAHTFGDCITSGIIIAGFIMAGKPSDREHPFGHERIESIAALVISNLLFVIGLEFVIISIKKIIHPSITRTSFTIMAVIAITMLAKEIMSRFSYELGNYIDSDALRADAIHHRTDVAATGIVLVALAGSRFNIFFLDGAMGVIVSLIIFYSAYLIFRNAVNILIGKAPSEETLEKIRNEVLKCTGVTGIHGIIIHQYGSRSVISLHAEVKEDISGVELHQISEDIEARIKNKMRGAMITVHMEPLNPHHPKHDAVKKMIAEIIADDRNIASFHNFRIIGQRDNLFGVIFDLVPAVNVEQDEIDRISNVLTDRLMGKFPGIKVFTRIIQ